MEICSKENHKNYKCPFCNKNCFDDKQKVFFKKKVCHLNCVPAEGLKDKYILSDFGTILSLSSSTFEFTIIGVIYLILRCFFIFLLLILIFFDILFQTFYRTIFCCNTKNLAIFNLCFFLVREMCNVNVEYLGLEKLSDGPIIYTAMPHTSYYDLLVLAGNVNDITLIAHENGLKNIVGFLLKFYFNIIIVHTGETDILKIVKNAIDDNPLIKLAFFPTGMLANYKTLPVFQAGMFKCGLNIQPIVLLYDQNISGYKFLEILMGEGIKCKVIVEDTINLSFFYNKILENKVYKNKRLDNMMSFLYQNFGTLEENIHIYFAEYVRLTCADKYGFFLSNVSCKKK